MCSKLHFQLFRGEILILFMLLLENMSTAASGGEDLRAEQPKSQPENERSAGLLSTNMSVNWFHVGQTNGILGQHISTKSDINGLKSRKAGKRDASVPKEHYLHSKPCHQNEDCFSLGTSCDTTSNVCSCPKGYLIKTGEPLGSIITESHNKPYASMLCLRLAQIGEECLAQEQCFSTHSVCSKNGHNSSKIGQTTNKTYCLCEESYLQEDGIERVEVKGEPFVSNIICRYYNQGLTNTQIGVIIAAGCLFTAMLLTCVIGFYKMRKNKPPVNIITAMSMVNCEPVDPSAGNGLQVDRDLSNLPPMGSAEAEFQNDFIPVFPMHHLKPCPEKNTTALNMQFTQGRT